MSRKFEVTSVPDEFSFSQDARLERGNFQTEIPPEEIVNEIGNLPECIDYDKGFKLLPITEDTFNSVRPNTPKGNAVNWKVLVVMQAEFINEAGNPQLWRKAALINPVTRNLTLISSTNIIENGHSKSHLEGWGILRSRMFAPTYFWKELTNRIKYSLIL